jgi:hypothetical protein
MLPIICTPLTDYFSRIFGQYLIKRGRACARTYITFLLLHSSNKKDKDKEIRKEKKKEKNTTKGCLSTTFVEGVNSLFVFFLFLLWCSYHFAN